MKRILKSSEFEVGKRYVKIYEYRFQEEYKRAPELCDLRTLEKVMFTFTGLNAESEIGLRVNTKEKSQSMRSLFVYDMGVDLGDPTPTWASNKCYLLEGEEDYQVLGLVWQRS